jgi:hypothetical protein
VTKCLLQPIYVNQIVTKIQFAIYATMKCRRHASLGHEWKGVCRVNCKNSGFELLNGLGAHTWAVLSAATKSCVVRGLSSPSTIVEFTTNYRGSRASRSEGERIRIRKTRVKRTVQAKEEKKGAMETMFWPTGEALMIHYVHRKSSPRVKKLTKKID